MDEQSRLENAAYSGATNAGGAAANELTPSYRLFDSTSIALATFLGSPVAGAGLMALNYRRMGRGSNAVSAFIGGVAVTAAAIGFGYWIPQYAGGAVAIVLVVAVKNCAKALQGDAVEEHVRNGGKLASRWIASGLGLAMLALIFAGVFMVVLAREPGSKIVVGSRDDIYYSAAATKQDASTLGEALKTAGYFRDQGASVLLSKGKDGAIVSFLVKEGAWQQPEIVLGFEEIGRQIAPSVGGFPIKVRLVNSSRDTMTELIVGKVIIGTKDEIYYFGESTEAAANALGQSLKSAGFFEDRGVSTFLSKGDDGTTVSFVVVEGYWEKAANVAAFEGLVRQCASALGGLPIKLRLVNSKLEIQKEVTVS
jgi:hypothetical protein